MKTHKLAKHFPALVGDEFDLFVQDIEENGQLEPIVLYEGKILDGVNRWRACKKLSVEPIVEEYDGDDPLGYVISLNIRRRHLSESQLGWMGKDMRPDFAKRAKQRQKATVPKKGEKGAKSPPAGGRSAPQSASKDVADLLGISERTVDRAVRISKDAPEAGPAIRSGELTLGAVDAEIRKKKAEAAAKATEKREGDKEIRAHPKVVKEYLDATQVFKDAINLAIVGAKRDRFSPEAGKFIKRRHKDISTLVDGLEELL